MLVVVCMGYASANGGVGIGGCREQLFVRVRIPLVTAGEKTAMKELGLAFPTRHSHNNYKDHKGFSEKATH